MTPIQKLRALLESKGIYDQAIRLMRAHVALREATKKSLAEKKQGAKTGKR